MAKIKVLFHSKTVGYSGTDRSIQLFAKYLSMDNNYEPFIVYREDGENSRLQIMQDVLGKDHILSYKWIPGKKGKTAPYLPEEDDFYDVVKAINPDIALCSYSGYNEWPIMKWLFPKHTKLIGHNIFGFAEKQRQCDKIIYISNFIRNSALNAGGPDGPVLYNPTELPFQHEDFLARKRHMQNAIMKPHFNIPENGIMIGRVGRPDNFDPIALEAFASLVKLYPNIYYFIVNPCERWKDAIKRLDIKNNTRILAPIIDDIQLSTFYATMDIYAHARSDGECNGCNINEAMIHGLPIISHYASTYQGHVEQLQDVGFVVPQHDYQSYARILEELINNKELRKEYGQKAFNKAKQTCEASFVINKLKQIYDQILS